MRFLSRLILCALTFALLTACQSASVADRQAVAQSHVAEQTSDLSGAAHHLQAARTRLDSEPDPQKAGDEIEAGYAQLQQANALSPKIQQDITDLGSAAESLQKQIDSHQTDLLGPRGKKIRNRILILLVLAAVGWGLLQLGPLFGGPIGGAVIVAGHVLTAFVVPLIGLAAKSLAALWRWIVTALGNLASSKTAAAVPTPTSPST